LETVFEIGDYLFHIEYGVCQYQGVKKLDHGVGEEDYMLLEFANGARLYEPLTTADKLQKYGYSEVVPVLDRLGL